MSSSDKENEYPWVPYKRAASYLKEAERLNAAPTARIPKGFMSQYAKYKTKNRMKNKTRKRWLGMMMWAYDAGRMPAQ